MAPYDERTRTNKRKAQVMSPFRSEEEEDDLFDHVSAMADRMGIEGEKRENYIDDHMLQGGYTRVQSRESYVRIQEDPNADEGGRDDGGRWGFGGGRGRSAPPDRGGRGGQRPPIRSQQRGAEDDRY